MFVNKLAKRLSLRVRIPLAVALAVTLVGLIYVDRQNRRDDEAANGSTATFQVVEATSRDFNGAPALALTFNRPLDAERGYGAFLQVRELSDTGGDDGKPVVGTWKLEEDHRLLLFSRIKPQTRYLVRAMGGLSAENGARLAGEARFVIMSAGTAPSP